MTHDSASLDASRRTANLVLLSLAAAYFLFEWIPGFVGVYGYFIDELYYLACANHLAFGYVDHPPVSVALLHLVRGAIGDSLPALRLVPALIGAATVALTGLLARRLGAGVFGQALAAGAAMASPIYQILFGFYSMNSIAILLWAVCFWLLIEIERRNEPRLWLVFGAVAGLGLENKHTFVLLGLGLAVGLLLTPARRHLARRWLWGGLGLAGLLLLPNVIWQVAHGWPSLEFYRNADLYKNVPTPPLEILKEQILLMNPAAAPVWIAGAVFFLASGNGRGYRHLGWTFVALFVLLLVGQKSRPDRIAAAYTVVLAAGGVLLEGLSRKPWGRWLRIALPAALVLCGAALAPIAQPLLPPSETARYAGALGIAPQIERGAGKQSQLPQWLADRFGWPELERDVEAVVDTLSPDERRRAMILAPSYGQAGAIEHFGRGRNLPPVYAIQNSYHSWGPPPDSLDVAVIVGFSRELLQRIFRDVELAGIHHCTWCMPWRDEAPLWIARRPMVPLSQVWSQLKSYQ